LWEIFGNMFFRHFYKQNYVMQKFIYYTIRAWATFYYQKIFLYYHVNYFIILFVYLLYLADKKSTYFLLHRFLAIAS
jgi:hypothetical protein